MARKKKEPRYFKGVKLEYRKPLKGLEIKGDFTGSNLFPGESFDDSNFKLPEIYFLLNLDDIFNRNRKILDPFSSCVADCVVSLWYAQNTWITPPMMWRAMNDDKHFLSESKWRAREDKLLVEILERFFEIMCEIDWKRSPELKKLLRGTGVTTIKHSGWLLGAYECVERKKGTFNKYFYELGKAGRPWRSPINLFQYSVLTNRLLAIDPQLLGITKVVDPEIPESWLFLDEALDGIDIEKPAQRMVTRWVDSSQDWPEAQIMKKILLQKIEPIKRSVKEETSIGLKLPTLKALSSWTSKEVLQGIFEFWRAIGYIENFEVRDKNTAIVTLMPETAKERQKREQRERVVLQIRTAILADFAERLEHLKEDI